MMGDSDFKADLARYPRRPFLKEQSIWAIWVYRLGRRAFKRKPGIVRSFQLKICWLLFRIIETLTGVSLPPDAQIGPGLRIYHFGNIFIHSGAIIGRNCTLRQGVTIGNRFTDGAAPVVEDNVEFGAYAQALGGITIGANSRVGALSLVLYDVPPDTTVLGNPARPVSGKLT